MKRALYILAVIDAFMLAFIFACIILPMATEGAYVNAPEGVRVRAEPDTKSDVLEVLPFGDEVSGKVKDGWMHLSDRDGYVCADYVQGDDPRDAMTYMGNWRVTAYAYTGSACANGQYPETGYTIACNSLPFGTEVFIEGVGFRTVEDRGPAWLGDEWCDLYLGDYVACVTWGDQYHDVYLIEGDEQ